MKRERCSTSTGYMCITSALEVLVEETKLMKTCTDVVVVVVSLHDYSPQICSSHEKERCSTSTGYMCITSALEVLVEETKSMKTCSRSSSSEPTRLLSSDLLQSLMKRVRCSTARRYIYTTWSTSLVSLIYVSFTWRVSLEVLWKGRTNITKTWSRSS